MLLKWVFLGALGVGLGILLRSEQSRNDLKTEIQTARLFINDFLSRYEGWQVVFVSVGLTLILANLHSYIFEENIYTFKTRLCSMFFRLVRRLPGIGAKVNREVSKTLKTMEKDSFSPKLNETYRNELPKKGLTHEEVMEEVSKVDDLASIKWNEGWVSGALYNSTPELTKLCMNVFGRHAWSNPLHLDVFPQIKKMEAEVVKWSLDLFNGGKDSGGIVTSGGTESILMAMRAYREMGYERGIKYPEIICGVSAHAAFCKAADYFRMKITLVPLDPCTQMVDMRAMARAISSSTVVLIGSAPQYPHGIIDPIQAIAQLALKNNIGMHVDACLGGFILAFMEKAGYELDPFDFRVKGVTSLSADTHKYGYAPKGTSVVLYANKELRLKQYFVDPNWQGGVYATAGIGGSRPGCLIATTWATMLYMGEDGYIEATRKIIETTKVIVKGLECIPGIKLLGKPKAMLVAISSDDFDIFRLSPLILKKGWYMNVLQNPPGIHMCVTLVHTKEGVADRFINDIKECAAKLMSDPKTKATGKAAFYGQAATIPDRSIVNELGREYLDLVYKVTPPQ